MFQPFAHTHNIIDCIAETPIKLDHTLVGCSNLQIDLGTTRFLKQSLRLGDDRSSMTTALKLWIYCQIVQPASMPFVTAHHSGDNLTVHDAHQKQVRPHDKLALNISIGVVPGSNQITSPPKRHDRFLVVWIVRANLHRIAV